MTLGSHFRLRRGSPLMGIARAEKPGIETLPAKRFGGHDRQRHTSRRGHRPVTGHDEEIPPHRHLLNINDAILAVIALVGAEAQRNRVSLRTELSNDLPLVVGDRIQLQQVILNLIMNAIEAMRGIDQAQRKVMVVSRKDESKGALVEVQDSGAGLEGLSLERLFDAFYATKPDGMGIGLAVSRTIIKSHGGQLRALPNVPKGAVFQFQLPTNGEVIEQPV